MEKQAVVKNIQPNGSYDWNGKTYFRYEIEMDNGDVGEYSSISDQQTHFHMGVLVNYIWDVSKPQYPKIKPVYQFNAPDHRNGNAKNLQKAKAGDDVQLMIVKQSCLKAAVEYTGPNNSHVNVSQVTEIAQFFVDWVMGKSPKRPKKQSQKETTDLPF